MVQHQNKIAPKGMELIGNQYYIYIYEYLYLFTYFYLYTTDYFNMTVLKGVK